MSTIITPSEDQINIVITDDAVNVNVTSEPVVVNVTEEIIQVSPISGAYPLPTTVYSVFGRTGSVVAQEGDYDLGKLSDVVLLDLANNDVLSYNGTNWVNEPMDLSGYVTLATDQTITGSKIFEKGLLLKNISSPLSQVGFTGISGCSLNNGIDIIFNGTNNIQGLFFETSTSHDYTFPDASGTLALLEADQSFSGQKTFTDITFFNQSASFLYGAAFKKGNTSSVMGLFQTDVFITAATGNKNLVIQDISTSFAKLQFQNTGNLTYTFPNASGTIALTSDIPSLTGYVPYTGATTHLNLGIWGLGASTITVGQNSTQGYIRFRTGGATQLSAETCQAPYGTNGMIFSFDQTSSNYKQFVLNSSLLTNNTIRTYSMPNASGTIALTSDLASYVPYTGATATLNLGSQMLMTSGYIRGGNSLQVLYNPSSSTYDTGYNTIQGNATSFAVINPTTGFRFIFPSTASYFYTLPDATGTIALTSDIPSSSTFVTLAGLQTITGNKEFSGFIKATGSLFLKNNLAISVTSGYGTIGFNQVGSVSKLTIASDNSAVSSLIFDNTSAYNYTFPTTSGTIALTSNLASYVPYTGATANVNLGTYSLTANALIKNGGVDTQFLKADGSVDNNVYLTANDLPSTLSLYATTTASAISGYTKLVTTIDDPDYNTTAVDVSTGVITATDQFIAALVSPANLINGNPGVFNVTTTGNIKKVSGTGESEFYFKIYKRTSAGVETLIGTSSNTLPVVNSGYAEFSATAIWNDGTFDVTDSIVLKYYATRISGGSNPTYNFQFGGVAPVRTLVPIPIAVIPNIYMADLADVENVAPLNNEILHYNSTSTLWEHSTIAGLLGYTPANDASVVKLAGAQTITGFKTIANGLSINGQLALGGLSYGGSISFLQGTPHGFGPSSTVVAFEDENTIKFYVGQPSINYKYFVFDVSAIDFDITRTYNLPNASGTIALTSNLASYVPYTGATSAVTLGAYSLTAASLIKSGGTSAQILAADGSVITAGTNITISGGTISASGGGGGSITLAAIGTTPNANAATLTGSVLNLEPASASFGGVVTTGGQTFGGDKTFNGQITSNGTYITNNTDGGAILFKTATISSALLTNTFLILGSGSKTDFNAYVYGANPFGVWTDNIQRFTISGTGNIGIATSTIGSKLQVNGNAAIGYSASTAAPTNGLTVSGSVAFGTNTTINLLQVAGSQTASAGNATTILLNPTLIANANSNTLTAVSINPTFTLGAFTNVKPVSLMVNGGSGFTGYFYAVDIKSLGGGGMAVNGEVNIANGTYVDPYAGVGYDLKMGGAGNAIATRGRVSFDNGTVNTNGSGSLSVGTTNFGSKFNVNGNAAIGYSASTAAPTNGLAVAGQSTFSDNVTVSKNQNAVTEISLINTTSGTGAGVEFRATSDIAAGAISFGKFSTLRTAYKIVQPKDCYFYNGTAGDYAFLNDFATGSIKFAAGASSTAHLTLNSNGSLGLGISTPVASALLQISSTTKGFLPPVMTTTQKNAIATPATGLVVFDSTLGKLCVFSTTWQTITSV